MPRTWAVTKGELDIGGNGGRARRHNDRSTVSKRISFPALSVTDYRIPPPSPSLTTHGHTNGRLRGINQPATSLVSPPRLSDGPIRRLL